jgi:hypothetical protein
MIFSAGTALAAGPVCVAGGTGTVTAPVPLHQTTSIIGGGGGNNTLLPNIWVTGDLVLHPITAIPAQRAYTPADLERMRAAERARLTYQRECGPIGTIGADFKIYGSYCPEGETKTVEPDDATVEMRVQTDIIAGVGPDALEAK